MKRIKLTQNQYTMVDDWNYEWLSQWKWSIHKHKQYVYAIRNDYSNGKQRTVAMHREIMGLTFGDKQCVDHISHNTLDNKEKNLRLCSRAENIRNITSNRGSSKYKGVRWHKKNQKWEAYIRYARKLIYLGCYPIETDAAKAYNEAAIKYFGEFAHLNRV